MSGRRRRARLGQHLLRDERVLGRIIDALPEQPAPMLEVGAGDGVLTERLAELGRPARFRRTRRGHGVSGAAVDYHNVDSMETPS